MTNLAELRALTERLRQDARLQDAFYYGMWNEERVAKDTRWQAADALEAAEAREQALQSNYQIAQAYWDLTLARAEAAEARSEALEKGLEPFAAAGETASKIADLHGENEFVLSFGPVPVGVIPLQAFISAVALLSPKPEDETP